LELVRTPPGLEPSTKKARTFGGRYQVSCSLKRGQGIETLVGVDLVNGQPVVIKTTAGETLSLGAQMRLEHEASVLRLVRSPWIAPLLYFGREGDLLYLVMPQVPGITLAERLARGPLGVDETITVGRCLFGALQEVHGLGVLHRDLKPANVIVDDGTPLQTATVIDFGLARSARLDAPVRDQPVGTARYISPEQAGLLDRDADERSDLYSAGVVLFECLAGQPPFAGESLGEVLWQHMTVRPPELRSLGLAIPRALDEIVQRLLRKDPGDRYQSAEAVLADLAQLAKALARGRVDPALVVGLHDRRRTLTEPAFVGRERELAALDAQLERTRQGDGSLVLLESESGGGKSRLLAELAQRGIRQGAWVLRGQGRDREAQRPFQMLSGVAAELIAAARRDESLAEAIQARLGEQQDAACAALPELAEILGTGAEQRLGPETFGQVRSLLALSALLEALGSAQRPALVVLDDCQWADELALRLLTHWQRRREPGKACHTLLVVAFRSEEVPAGHALRAMQPALHLDLPAFEARDVRRLAESMAGPLPEEAIAVVERLSEGSPFMAAAVLQGLVETGALMAEPVGWRVDPLALQDVQSSRHAAAFLVRRIESLPAGTLDLLSAGAVLGKEFDLDLAAVLAGQAPAQAIAAVDEARRRHIVWARSQGTHCTFIHDKLRQTLLEQLRAADRQELHRRAALHLEQHTPERLFELAYHFDAAGQSGRALPYALAAAERARAQHSLEIAEQQYRIAERGLPRENAQGRLRIAKGLGDVFMLRGRYDEAAEQFQTARALAPAGLAQAQLEGKLGELAFKRGDAQTAGEHVERSLHLLGRRAPRWSVTFLLCLVWEVLVQLLHTLLPRWFLARRALAGAEAELLAIRLYSRLAHLYWFHRGTVPALWAHLREMNLAERYPPTPELAQAYSEHAPAMSLVPYFRRGIAYAERSLAIRKELGDLWGQGQSLHFHGVVLYASSRFEECIAKCREAVRLLERTGDYWEVHIARYQIAASLYRLGRLAEAVTEAQRLHRSGLELGDAQASGISLDVWARASLGRVPAEVVEAELARPGDVQRTAQLVVAQGARLIHAGRPQEAAEVLAHAHRLAREAGVKNAWVAPLLPWLATALRRQIEQSQDVTPRRRRRLLCQARAAARQGLRRSRRLFGNELPHALRENALLCAMQNQLRRARRFFDESLAVAERQGAVYEHAQSLLARGRVGRELGWPGAAEDVAQAEKTLSTLEAEVSADADPGLADALPATLSLADRFDTILDAGRRIASALSRDDIFAAVREAGLKLLRGERCLVLKVEGEARVADSTSASGEMSFDYSRAVVRRALAAGRAIALVEGISEQASESVLLAGVRSALCAPIFVRGRAAACLYVSHRQIAGLFGREEERLGDFVATLAGAALENADGFAELRRLNETLEQQLAEIRRAEKRIQEQAALLDKARDAIMVVDLDERIGYWNQSSEGLYGWSAAEAIGKKTSELFCREPSALLGEALAITLARGEWTGELRQLTRAGAEIVVESRWTLVRDNDGRPKARLVVDTDVTEKKHLEAKFLRAQRLESLGTLAGGVAHDFNNVLTPIVMAVDILKDDLPVEQRQAILDSLEASARRGADMVKQILSFARGVEGQRVPLHLKHVIREAESMLQHTLPKSIEIRTAVDRDLWLVSGDGTQLHQLVMNLCVNARDAMPQGGVLTITADNVHLTADDLRTGRDVPPGPFIQLEVQDTGTGIAPEVVDKIFDPFFTTKELGKGTGLGLSTVLGIVKGHGGFIDVTSRVGTGTCFRIYLPAAETAAAQVAEHQDNHQGRGHGELILVVDDETPIRQIMKTNLEANGYKVLTAADGIEAGDVYAMHGADIQLVVTDMMMPRMDGQATIRMLKTMNPNVRIIAASGLEASVEGNQGVEAAFQAFLRKPFKADQLLQTVDEVLHAAPAARKPLPASGGHN
jgi:PAS domain S-box-containing protein